MFYVNLYRVERRYLVKYYGMKTQLLTKIYLVKFFKPCVLIRHIICESLVKIQ